LSTDGRVGYYDVEDPTTGVRTTFISSDIGNDVTADSLGNKSVWRKYTISIDTYIGLLRETTGDWAKNYSSYCPLVRIYAEGSVGDLYVGDIFFENV
jgi:hypothetical protein